MFLDILLQVLAKKAIVKAFKTTKKIATKGLYDASPLKNIKTSQLSLNRQLEIYLKSGKKIQDIPREIASFFNTTPASLRQRIKTSPGKVAEQLGRLNTQQRRILGLAIQAEAQNEGKDASLLNSSWLKAGVWTPSGIGTSGTLNLTLIDGNSYDYPGVDILVWESMKSAKGRNGSGAGSVFWALYLRSFLSQ